MSQIHAQNVRKSCDILRQKLGARKPKIAFILGSGLGGLADKIKSPVKVPYKSLPGFPKLTVPGHTGEVIAGTLNGVEVIALKGRKHFYETADAVPLKTMIRTMKALGIPKLFISNAAGSVSKKIGVSALMTISDHINYMGLNPLTGPNDDAFGPRFFSLTDAWSPALRKKLHTAAKKTKIKLHEGVYMAFLGPSFETPAEIRMAQKLGASAIGMSSAPDCIIARHCGMEVVGVSCITNMGAGLSKEKLSHAHTLKNAARGADNFEKLVMAFVTLL
jgi:xanthosine phosphorylase